MEWRFFEVRARDVMSSIARNDMITSPTSPNILKVSGCCGCLLSSTSSKAVIKICFNASNNFLFYVD